MTESTALGSVDDSSQKDDLSATSHPNRLFLNDVGVLLTLRRNVSGFQCQSEGDCLWWG